MLVEMATKAYLEKLAGWTSSSRVGTSIIWTGNMGLQLSKQHLEPSFPWRSGTHHVPSDDKT